MKVRYYLFKCLVIINILVWGVRYCRGLIERELLFLLGCLLFNFSVIIYIYKSNILF